MAFITTEDFIGKFTTITNGFNTTDLSLFIERYETILLVEMLGKELYELWVESVGEITPDPIYLFLKEPFIHQSECGEILNSRGVADMLLGFIYFIWQSDKDVQQTINSAVKIKGENSKRAGLNFVYSRYNESIDTYKAIQAYCMEKSSDYPEFQGVEKGYSYLTAF